MLAIVPQKQVHVKNDLFVAVIHRRSGQQNQHKSICHLDQTLQTCGDRLHIRVALAQIMRFINDQQPVIKCFVNPLLCVSRLQFKQLTIDHRTEGVIPRKLVELSDNTIRKCSQTNASVRHIPLLGLRLNTHQHVEIAASRTLLGGQQSLRLVQRYAVDVEDLCFEVRLHRRSSHNQYFLLLKLRAQNIFFCNLNSRARFAHTGAVNHQQIASRTIWRQHTTQKLLMALELIVGCRVVAQLCAQLLESL